MRTNELHTKHITWSSQEWAAIIRNSPELLSANDPHDRFNTAMRAQMALPPERRRTKKGVYGMFVQRADRTRECIAEAVSAMQESTPPDVVSAMEQAGPNSNIEATPANQFVFVGPKSSIEPTLEPEVALKANTENVEAKIRRRIVWTRNEWIALAHDDEVTPHLGKAFRVSLPRLAEAVDRAQRRHVPEDRWRSRDSIYQATWKPEGENGSVLGELRRAMRFPPLPKPLVPAPAVSPVEPAILETPVETPASPVEAPAEAVAAAAPADPLLAALEVVCTANKALLAAVLTTLRAEQESAIQGAIKMALAQQADMIRATMRDSIHDLLGSTSPQQEPPPPDFRMDRAAEAAAQEAVERAAGKRPRVDVVGLLNGQAEIVRRACGASFDLRFLTQQEAIRSPLTAPVAILLRKFVGHDAQERIKSAGAKLMFANGGPESVLKVLNELSHET